MKNINDAHCPTNNVQYQFNMLIEEPIAGKNIFWSTLKSKRKENFRLSIIPFEPPAKWHCQLSQYEWN